MFSSPGGTRFRVGVPLLRQEGDLAKEVIRSCRQEGEHCRRGVAAGLSTGTAGRIFVTVGRSVCAAGQAAGAARRSAGQATGAAGRSAGAAGQAAGAAGVKELGL